MRIFQRKKNFLKEKENKRKVSLKKGKELGNSERNKQKNRQANWCLSIDCCVHVVFITSQLFSNKLLTVRQFVCGRSGSSESCPAAVFHCSRLIPLVGTGISPIEETAP